MSVEEDIEDQGDIKVIEDLANFYLECRREREEPANSTGEVLRPGLGGREVRRAARKVSGLGQRRDR